MIGADDVRVGAGCAGAGDLRVLPPDQRLLLFVGSRGTPLVLVARRPGPDAALYLPHRDAAQERSDGPRLSAEDAEEAGRLTGIEVVQGFEALALDLQRLVLKRGHFRCYTPLSPAEQARAMRDQLLRAAATAGSDPWETASTRERGSCNASGTGSR